MDFVLKKEKTLLLVQVCWQQMEKETLIRELRALSEALDELSLEKGYLITFERDSPSVK